MPTFADITDLSMAMTLQGFHTTRRPNARFWQRFFNTDYYSPDDKIAFDRALKDDRKVANFVMPNVVSKANKREGYSTEMFTPAYIKEKDVIEAFDPALFSRIAGEPFGGTMSPDERAQHMRAGFIDGHIVKIENRLNAMDAELVRTGKVTIKGEDYPETVVDYRRDPNNTALLTGAQEWGQAGVDPFSSLGDAAMQIYDKCGGSAEDVVFSPQAWALFFKWITTEKKDWFSAQTKGAPVVMSQIAAGNVYQVALLGSIITDDGRTLNLWVDRSTYVDVDGTVVHHLKPYEVVIVDFQIFGGVQSFGAIKDFDAPNGIMPARYFSKEFTEKEPSALFCLTQSAPLPIAAQVNATFLLTVKS